jgi:hypothetical protein
MRVRAGEGRGNATRLLVGRVVSSHHVCAGASLCAHFAMLVSVPSAVSAGQGGEVQRRERLAARVAAGPGLWEDAGWLAGLRGGGLIGDLLASGVIGQAAAEGGRGTARAGTPHPPDPARPLLEQKRVFRRARRRRRQLPLPRSHGLANLRRVHPQAEPRHQPEADVRTVAQLELAQQVADVRLHRVFGDRQLGRDLKIG